MKRRRGCELDPVTVRDHIYHPTIWTLKSFPVFGEQFQSPPHRRDPGGVGTPMGHRQGTEGPPLPAEPAPVHPLSSNAPAYSQPCLGPSPQDPLYHVRHARIPVGNPPSRLISRPCGPTFSTSGGSLTPSSRPRCCLFRCK